MSESLKSARRGAAKLAVEECMQSGEYETPQYWERVRIVELALRVLQLQAMEALMRKFGPLAEPDSVLLDALLDSEGA